ncbi:MAG: tryptophan 7-halogenase, partial [Pseudomonadales bacterium]|nr:tryptophan 7-halogenase [Pseudomonadales bacterium]
MEQEIFDVMIAGGGLAGLTLAAELERKRPGTRVLILEKQEFPVPEAAYKVGESSVEIGSWYLEQLGLREHFQADHLPKYGLRFFFNRPEHRSLDAGVELGLTDHFDTPSYHLDRGRLENYLFTNPGEACLETGARIIDMQLDDSVKTVDYIQNGTQRQARGRWLVDATGKAALLKRRLKLAEKIDHNINAVWFRVDRPIRIDDWSDFKHHATSGPCRQRWLSTIHLMGPGYWVWMIPLAGDATSIGIVSDPSFQDLRQMNTYNRALAWLKENQPLLAEHLPEDADGIMDFAAVKQIARGCSRLFSEQRWAITGEAGLFLDPLYSP